MSFNDSEEKMLVLMEADKSHPIDCMMSQLITMKVAEEVKKCCQSKPAHSEGYIEYHPNEKPPCCPPPPKPRCCPPAPPPCCPAPPKARCCKSQEETPVFMVKNNSLKEMTCLKKVQPQEPPQRCCPPAYSPPKNPCPPCRPKFCDKLFDRSKPCYPPRGFILSGLREDCARTIPEPRLTKYVACASRHNGLQDDCDPISEAAIKECCNELKKC